MLLIFDNVFTVLSFVLACHLVFFKHIAKIHQNRCKEKVLMHHLTMMTSVTKVPFVHWVISALPCWKACTTLS